MTHACDPSTAPLGGLLTLARVYSAIVAVMNIKQPDVIGESDHCQRCRTLFSITMTGIAASASLERNPNSRMGFEMALAAVQAALDRGDTETPADGFA